MYQELVRIISNKEVLSGIYLMKVACYKIAAESRPGQYVMITCDHGKERLLRRPISIHRKIEGGLEFLYAVVGGGTRWLAERVEGDNLDILGPLGNGFLVDAKVKSLLLVAGGMGIAPLVYLAEDAIQDGKKVVLLAGARNAGQLVPASMLPEKLDFKTATEDGSAGFKGLITSLLPEYPAQAGQVFICGPLPMYKAIAENYADWFKGKSVQVSLEVRMGCGLGFCYACTVKTRQGLKQVCKDGPVFEMGDVIWSNLN